VARTWISYGCVPCHPWCTHRTCLVVKKKSVLFMWLWTIPFVFLVINACNHGEHHETLCIMIWRVQILNLVCPWLDDEVLTDAPTRCWVPHFMASESCAVLHCCCASLSVLHFVQLICITKSFNRL
jgi:hypothetical protein